MAQNSAETTLAFPARLAPEPEGGVTVTFRDLPEAITYGATRSDAEAMAEEVLELAVVERMDRGEHIPAASPAQSGEVLVALRLCSRPKRRCTAPSVRRRDQVGACTATPRG